MEPCDGAVILFSSPDHAQQFVDKDPYNTGGLVTKYQVCEGGDGIDWWRGREGPRVPTSPGRPKRQSYAFSAQLSLSAKSLMRRLVGACLKGVGSLAVVN